jgi:hypothetical protein
VERTKNEFAKLIDDAVAMQKVPAEEINAEMRERERERERERDLSLSLSFSLSLYIYIYIYIYTGSCRRIYTLGTHDIKV